MPIVTAYAGEIYVRASSKDDANGEMYYISKKAYGQTLGELLDNMVEVSVKMADEVFVWVTLNKPADYTLKNDYWSFGSSHPDVLECHSKEYNNEHDMGSGGSISNIESIVRNAVLHRDITVSSTLNSLRFASRETSELPNEAAVSYNDIYDAVGFSDMVKCGYSGSELDMILKIGEREGRIESYNASLANIRYVRAQASKKKAAAGKSRWWRNKS